MGQKIHPYGFRLGIFQKHQANWFASKSRYTQNIFEDLFIRQFFLERFQDAGILQIQIDRKFNNHIQICIFLTKPGFFISSKDTQLSTVQKLLEKNLITYHSSRFFHLNFLTESSLKNTVSTKKLAVTEGQPPIKLTIQLMELVKIEQKAAFLADFLIQQLEKRIAFRRAVKKTLKRAERSKLQGIKIQIAGRLNGAEIARTEWTREGRVPLQTLRANIDYSSKTAKTIYGILGVKIWVFLDANTL
uniref:Small ribosomal subunit protein uS3c n=1 Tax=Lambia antarctica TaxID=101717 RepID=A0A1L2EE04_9CHLO|nr:30S ribosomal protein S3 [Lambia antarctica]ANN39057.1 30S ribosomal protein S3 [Lambia antarctica]